MTTLSSPIRLISRVRHRGRIVAAQAYLTMRRRMSRGPVWIDSGCVKLPFHGDGDRQELYYFLDAKAFWNKELQLASRFLKPGDVVVDVGANIGFMSGIYSTLTGATGQVHSFEPSPTVYAKLLAVIKANNYANVSPYNAGCGSHEGTMTLYCPASSGNATLRPDASLEQTAVERKTVSIVKLDTFLGPKLERWDYLKIDTEGYEDEVIAGAAVLLKKFRPTIYIELGPQYEASSQRAIRLLRDLGYTFEQEVDIAKSANGENFFALPPKS